MKNTVKTNWVKIFMAGEIDDAKKCCQKFCDDIGLCVTIEPTDYIYTGGSEIGFVVGLINYPRFPSTPSVLFIRAKQLADLLLQICGQDSFTIMTPEETYWYTTRENQKVGF